MSFYVKSNNNLGDKHRRENSLSPTGMRTKYKSINGIDIDIPDWKNHPHFFDRREISLHLRRNEAVTIMAQSRMFIQSSKYPELL